MHQSALAHMQLCFDIYLKKDKHYRVLDFGSRNEKDVHPNHDDMLKGWNVTLTGTDVMPGRGVDVVMTKPYRIPLKSKSMDVIVCGQVFEHIPFFWASFLEMCRVLTPGGLIFLTAPSRGHVHYGMDPWRYYPDSMRSLAAFSRMKLREAHTDLPPTIGRTARYDYQAIDTANHYWGDTVGVFQKPQKPSRGVAIPREVLVWWANKVGGIDHVQAPAPRPRRLKIASKKFG